MKKLFSLIVMTLFLVPTSFAQNRYIADNLFTYMHAGPSNQFRIIGSVNAGDKVDLVNSDRKAGYSQIVDSKGRKGWVESKFVSKVPSMAERLPLLEKELAEVKEKLATARQTSDEAKAGLVESLSARNTQIKDLESSQSEMNKQLLTSQDEVRELRAKLDTQKEDLLLKYFMYGGGVAGLGLLFGLLLPHMIPSRKKSPNGWS
ncbi:TIGR04211 family SH3 domain-containing protein [Vibrio tapetis subsp. quintayensis]|uniref:TIGR04211 family SH3 domain-containing protein n=1 Tax=Vibrio tapetis TaxID=52443 RepID=UPI0025B61FCA|nr:TIGR04211 family SH3 domain-containing protein [Vibrio tapetis]MDN3681585.1 TIGR04211 family SH3 domain-containing protein [Vibrio tapetis subsp. quintayensis]